MSSSSQIDPGSYSFAENITLDLHDIVTILLRERLLSDTRFQFSKLKEVCDGSYAAFSVPFEHQKRFLEMEAPKQAYILHKGNHLVEPHDFLRTDFKCTRAIDAEEVETIYWRVKNFDSGYLLHHALQLVLDYFPKSSTLRIRTSEGYSFSCNPQAFIVAEIDILPKVLMYINHIQPRLTPKRGGEVYMEQYAFGDRYITSPWVYLVFFEKPELSNKDDVKTVALDINVAALGNRGFGGEVFAMERRGSYHNKVLPRAASEDFDITTSPRISARSDEKAIPAIELAKRVLSRLEKIAQGKERCCGYCGKSTPKAQCSRCRGKTKYCGSDCQKKAWRYHKTWCKIDAAEADRPKVDEDVNMET